MEKIDKDKQLYQDIDSDFFYILKMIIYSIIGIVIFFLPIQINGEYKTLLYHIAYKLQDNFRSFLQLSTVVFVTISCIKDIIKDSDKIFNLNKVILYMRLISVLLLVNIFYGKNKGILLNVDISFLIEETVLNLITLLPISAIFITFILDYGLLDIIESYFQRIMKKLFNLSGKVVLNIIFYVFTDSFCGYFMTEKLYKSGKIRQNEACSIILNFSILSYPMINYISEELNLKKINLIIISTIILIIINIILCKIYPISSKKKSYLIKTTYKETVHKKYKFKKAVIKHLNNRNERNIFNSMINNFEESIYIIMRVTPIIILVLYSGYFIINYEVIIDLINQILYPLMSVLKIPNLNQLNVFIVNLFYNNIVAIDSLYTNIDFVTKSLIAVLAVINCTSISSNIIYLLNSDIPLNKKEIIFSYTIRIFTIIIVYFLGYYLYIGYIK